MEIKTKRGLNIPIKGEPTGKVQTLSANGKDISPKLIALNLDPFEELRFKLHAKDGDVVKKGQPLAEDKLVEGRMFVAPAAGVIKEVRRGLKRRLIDIVIEVSDKEDELTHPQINPQSSSKEDLKKRLMEGGAFAHIRQRPFNLLADPHKEPRDIFIQAVNTSPFAVPSEFHIEGLENAFQAGIDTLAKLTSGKVHLVYPHNSSCKAFTDAKNCEKHTAEGPHPAGNPSVHIHNIAPIQKVEDIVWTLTARDVALVGALVTEGKYLTDRVISIAGPGIIPGQTGYFKVRDGMPIESLIAGRIGKEPTRFISGSVLTGSKVEAEDFLGFNDDGFCAIPESTARELLHFFRLGIDKYSASKAYLSGHLSGDKKYNFTTSQHGETRGFIIASPYDNVMPMNIPTMLLVKAVMAEDFELAEELGFLEVASEDFALATFVCPSKIEMVDIMKNGANSYAQEVY